MREVLLRVIKLRIFNLPDKLKVKLFAKLIGKREKMEPFLKLHKLMLMKLKVLSLWPCLDIMSQK